MENLSTFYGNKSLEAKENNVLEGDYRHTKINNICNDTFQSTYKSATIMLDKVTYPPSTSTELSNINKGVIKYHMVMFS